MNEHLFARMQELRDLAGVIGLATWDQETYLPRKAEAGRAAQLGTMQALHHERLVDPRLADWLADAKPATPDETAMVRVLARERERAVKIPSALVKALAEAQSRALSAWREAREEKSFKLFQPHVQKLLQLRREMADAWGHDGERYDALLENYEPGMRVKRLSPVLTGLRSKLVPLVQAIDARPPPKRLFEGKIFDSEAQWSFTLHLLEAMGFDLEAGRQDRSTHPFTGGTGLHDVRLTTRVFSDLPLSSVFSTIHEGGHGLYEQGFSPEHERTTLAQTPSMGLHESQSRLWENIVGRSQPFWTYFFPKYQALFSTQLEGVSLADFLREVNRVERSFIRVEADEVTYNLHIVLRYELELELIRGNLQAADLEAAWNEKTKDLLQLEVKNSQPGRAPGHPLGLRRVRLLPHLRAGQPVRRVAVEGDEPRHPRAGRVDRPRRAGPGEELAAREGAPGGLPARRRGAHHPDYRCRAHRRRLRFVFEGEIRRALRHLRNMRSTLLVVLVVALVGCKDTAKPAAPKAVSSAAPAAPADIAPIEGALAYPFTQADSKLSWVGAKVTGKHEGGFGIFGGIIELTGSDPTRSRVRAEVDMTSLTTTPEKLVGHLKSPDFFAVEEFPRAIFVSTSIQKAGAGYSVTGTLTLHGVSRSLVFPATITVTGPEVTVNAEFALNRKDFGIVYPGKPDDLIADDVTLKLELHAKKKG